MTVTVAADATILPVAGGNNPGHPAACVLSDDTILTAWQNLDTGTITLTHHERDLTVKAQAAIAHTFPPDTTPGLGLVPTSGTTARLCHSYGDSWTVTTDPLTPSPASTVASSMWGTGPSSQVTHAGATYTTAGNHLVISSEGGVTATPSPGWAVGTVTEQGGVVTLAVQRGSGDGIALDLYTVGDGGSLSLGETGPALIGGDTYLGAARPGLYAAVEYLDGPGKLTIRDTSGAIIGSPDWPPGSPSAASSYLAAIGTRDGGLLAASYWRTFGSDAQSALTLHQTGPHGSHTVIADLATAGGAPLLIPPGWSETPVIAQNGRTAVVVALLMHVHGGDFRYGITAWTIDLGVTHDGILHIDTLTHPHWLVGTADPDMDWRLHIDGLVEILAGQDDQATHRLRVCDGTDWPVAAYLRPEA